MRQTKQLLSMLLMLIVSFSATAQYDCSDGRFTDLNYFIALDSTENVLYGSGTAVGGGPQNLEMCVFEPAGDLLQQRPLLVLAHGGSFIGGSRADVYALSENFARLGYVVAAIDYRVGLFFPNQVTTTLAIMRGMHDMKAAIRYFYMDAAANNTFGVDTNFIFAGGVSSGATTALHTAYFDEAVEIPAYMTNDTLGLGGVTGYSGNAGYSSEIAGVINFSGCIIDTAWMNNGDAALVGLHDLGDQVVPYETAEISISGFPTGLVANGTGSIMTRASSEGIAHSEMTYSGAGHASYLSGTQQEFDDAVDFVADFLSNIVCSTITGTAEIESDVVLQLFPNPVTDIVKVASEIGSGMYRIHDSTGRLMQAGHINSTTQNLDVGPLSKGIYFLSLLDGKKQLTKKLVKE